MAAPAAGLVRSIGRWTLAGLVLNGVLGSGIFGRDAKKHPLHLAHRAAGAVAQGGVDAAQERHFAGRHFQLGRYDADLGLLRALD